MFGGIRKPWSSASKRYYFDGKTPRKLGSYTNISCRNSNLTKKTCCLYQHLSHHLLPSISKVVYILIYMDNLNYFILYESTGSVYAPLTKKKKNPHL